MKYTITRQRTASNSQPQTTAHDTRADAHATIAESYYNYTTGNMRKCKQIATLIMRLAHPSNHAVLDPWKWNITVQNDGERDWTTSGNDV